MIGALDRSRGLPIGNLTSQLWGNFYLDELDHWIDRILDATSLDELFAD